MLGPFRIAIRSSRSTGAEQLHDKVAHKVTDFRLFMGHCQRLLYRVSFSEGLGIAFTQRRLPNVVVAIPRIHASSQ